MKPYTLDGARSFAMNYIDSDTIEAHHAELGATWVVLHI